MKTNLPARSIMETKACFDKAMQTADELGFDMPNWQALGTYPN